MGNGNQYAEEADRVVAKSGSGKDSFTDAEEEFDKDDYNDAPGQSNLGWLDLDQPRFTQDLANELYRTVPGLQEKYDSFTRSTGEILGKAEINEGILQGIKKQADRDKRARKMDFTNSKLEGFAAHAGIYSTASGTEGEQPGADADAYKTGFLNLEGSLKKRKLFPGIELVEENTKQRLEDYHPDKLRKLTQHDPKKPRWRPKADLGRYRVTDLDTYIKAIQDLYAAAPAKVPLQPLVEERIRSHIKNNNYTLPKMAGIAGLHAEVQALNFALSKSDIEASKYATQQLANTYIFTQRLVGDTNADFPACHNCSGIISGMEHVMTGRVKDYKKLERRHSTS